jgi:hypothetical protein
MDSVSGELRLALRARRGGERLLLALRPRRGDASFIGDRLRDGERLRPRRRTGEASRMRVSASS